MPSDSWKSAFKMALEDPQKILLKSTKNMNFLKPLFDIQFFLSFNFHFGHKTPYGQKHGKIRLKLFSMCFSVQFSLVSFNNSKTPYGRSCNVIVLSALYF